jgi:hypothetical protein
VRVNPTRMRPVQRSLHFGTTHTFA